MRLGLKTLVLFFAIINALGYLFMHIDKTNAQAGRQRISEASLLIIAGLGGSIGVLLGMYIRRHKTRKQKFTIGVPIILMLQVLLVLFLLK